MSSFYYHNCELTCDGVSLVAIAQAIGTPCYVYSAATITQQYQAMEDAWREMPHALHYALKANSTLAIVRLLRNLGALADANSGGEIEVALRAGYIPAEIVFTGVGKTPEELELAITLGVKTINVESVGELDRIDQIARLHHTRARIAIRINPDVDPLTHPHISTGRYTTKFGVPVDTARALAREAAGRTGLELIGLHAHIGSQVSSPEPLVRVARALVALVSALREDNIHLMHLDLGGGFAVPYEGPVPTAAEYARALIPVVRHTGLMILLEPGRVLVGPAAALVARVVDVKYHPPASRFVVLDAGMTELLRPALYGAFHRIEPVQPRSNPARPLTIVGPICETSDTLGTDRVLAEPRVGDLLAILDVGAYGSVMASTYNRRPLAPEVLVENDTWRVIRRRQSVEEMIALEE